MIKEDKAKVRFETVDEYIAHQPLKVRAGLKKIRKAVIHAAPGAKEVISYNMPAAKFHGMLLYYAAHTSHYGFYPYVKTIEAFKKKLARYECSKGTVRFPYNEPLPVKLIEEMVWFKVKSNLAKAALKELPVKKKNKK